MPYIGNTTTSFNVDSNNINNGSITTEKIAAGAVVNADVNDSASIAGTKISADFGAQNLVVDTSLLFVDATNDRVGVGTSSPTFRCQINHPAASATTDALVIQNTGTTSLGHTAGLRFKYNTAEPAAIRASLTNTDNGSARLGLFTSSDGTDGNLVERLSITSAGNVGIGNTSPGSPLTIVATTGQPILNASVSTGTNGCYSQFSNTAGALIVGRDNSSGGILGGGAYASHIYSQGAYPLVFSTDSTPRAQIDSSGRLLVGTSSNFVRGNLQVVDGGGGEITIARNDDSVVANNDIGHFYFASNDSGTGVVCAQIECYAEHDHTASSASTNLRFNTTAQGATTTTEQMRLTSTGDLQFNSGYGSIATAYGVRAWAKWRGDITSGGNSQLDGSGNVGSITDNGNGDYTINFTNAMPDTHYVVVGNCMEDLSGNRGDHLFTIHRTQLATGSARVNVINLGGTPVDDDFVWAAIIR